MEEISAAFVVINHKINQSITAKIMLSKKVIAGDILPPIVKKYISAFLKLPSMLQTFVYLHAQNFHFYNVFILYIFIHVSPLTRATANYCSVCKYSTKLYFARVHKRE
jgi:hypothetical protein